MHAPMVIWARGQTTGPSPKGGYALNAIVDLAATGRPRGEAIILIKLLCWA